MLRFILSRVGYSAVSLFLLSLTIFAVVRATGDPAVLRFGSQASLPENQPRIEALRREMGLDLPLPRQYLIWLNDVMHGEFGRSIHFHRDAGSMVAATLWPCISEKMYATEY